LKDRYDVITIGAGILGLATTYHILGRFPDADVLVLEQNNGPGMGSTARSAAAFRAVFSTKTNRILARTTIEFLSEIQAKGEDLGLKKVGYLWLLAEDAMEPTADVWDDARSEGTKITFYNPDELERELPGLNTEGIVRGVFAPDSGVINQNQLVLFYEREILGMGAEVKYGTKAMEILRLERDGPVNGVLVDGNKIEADTVIVAAGAWSRELLKATGLHAPIRPKKRQLFSVSCNTDDRKKLLEADGFSGVGTAPFIIVPGGAYMRPRAESNSFIMGYADEDRQSLFERDPKPEPSFFEKRVKPEIVRHFPLFDDAIPDRSWAGLYSYHHPDNTPIVYDLARAIVVGGASGSGIMKSDALGRVVAGLFVGEDEVELYGGDKFKVGNLAIGGRGVEPEKFLI
jgi:glycine/D-amino acid oxidase-like deaminating enzyme